MNNSDRPVQTNYVSQWDGILHAKCPRCRIGKVFSGPVYGLKMQKMNIHCPHCNLKFEREPGYFYVSMFVSYAMNVAEMITIAVAAYILGLPLTFDNLWYYISIIFIGVLLFAPLNYRYSRMILLYWLSPGLHYDPSKSAKDPQNK